MSDGMFMSESYATPIHYLDESGQYVDIDNNLIKINDGGIQKYKNAGNSFTAEFAETLSGTSPIFSIHKAGYGIDMYLNNCCGKFFNLNLTEDRMEHKRHSG